MQIINKFSFQKYTGSDENRPLKSLLFFCGESLETKLSGFVIDKQFELEEYFLLFINWDCPYEEGCNIYVLNKRKKVVGSYSFTAFYNSYNLCTVEEKSKHTFRLTFYESKDFEMTINYPKKHFFSKVISIKAITA